MNALEQFLRENFKIIKERRRSNDLLFMMKCPLCGDNKKKDNKNRVRAAFLIEDDLIRYHCFNCQKWLSISERLGDLAYLLSREKEISYSSAKQEVGRKLAKFYLTTEKTNETKKPIQIDFVEYDSIPGSNLQESGITWLKNRGFEFPNWIVDQFKQDGKSLFLPLTYQEKCFGFHEIHIDKKAYINHTEPNNLANFIVGLDDTTPHTSSYLIVESIIDAKLITFDSDGIVVGLALAGTEIGAMREKILESLTRPFVISYDNDTTGLTTMEKVKKYHPTWKGCFVPNPHKDYGEYRNAVGGIVAISYLMSHAVELKSPKLKIQRLSA